MVKPYTRDIKFRVTQKEFLQYKNDCDLVSKKYFEKFNASRFFRLCAKNISNDTFLMQIGYFAAREDIFKSLGLDASHLDN